MSSYKLLAVSSDYKTVKGEKLGVLTGVLYFAPANISGYQVCPKSSAGCRAACIYTAGRGAMLNVMNGRIRKTKLFFEDRATFTAQLVKDVKTIVKHAKKENMLPAIRLNGTSDITWEKVKVIVDGSPFPNLMAAFPEVQFYDYTKILNRKKAIALPNYHLTFSMSESNDKEAFKAIETGYNVAVVFDLKPSDTKPLVWKGFNVIDGDRSDVRFTEGKGNIVALSAKRKARKDTTGFVKKVA